MTNSEVEKILDDLERAKTRKFDIQMAKAQAELKTVGREREAYLDGIYDFAKAINRLLKEEATNAEMQ